MAVTLEDISEVRQLASRDHGLAVVVTLRSDGSPHCSVVNAGFMDHPVSRQPIVALVSRGDAVRLKQLRRHPRITVVFRAGWQWAAVEGNVELAGPDDHLAGLEISIPELLRDVFRVAGGTHDDWEEYDRVMAEERRTAVLVHIDRVYSNR